MAKTAAERKREQRKRDKLKAQQEEQHRIALEAGPFEMEMYRGDREALNRLMEAGDFEEPAEVISTLIHTADRAVKRDMSQVDCFLNVTRLRSREPPL